MANVSDEERGATMAEWGAWMGNLREKGKLKGGVPFNPESAAVINHTGETTPGFYAEGNNVNVGGFIHIVADNLEEAIAIAKSSPALHGPGSSVEVKEFMSMEMPS